MKPFYFYVIPSFFLLISCSTEPSNSEVFYNEISNSDKFIIYSPDKMIKENDFKNIGEFRYYIGIVSKMSKNDPQLYYKIYFSKNESSIPIDMDKDLLMKNLYLVNKSLQIFEIEAIKEANNLKNNNKSPQNLTDLKNISEKIDGKSWIRIDSLNNSLFKNFDTIKTNMILQNELNNLQRQ